MHTVWASTDATGKLSILWPASEAAAPTPTSPTLYHVCSWTFAEDQLPSEALISFGSKQSHAWLSCLLGHPWGPGDSTHKIHCLSDS